MDAITEPFDSSNEDEHTPGTDRGRLGAVNVTPIGATGAPPHILGKVDLSGAAQINAEPTVEVTLQSLLQAGVHFGHQTSRWHPNMAPYIHSVRNGIHIINLPKTVEMWKAARRAVVETVANGGTVLFVGTKKQAQQSIIEEAQRCGAYFVARRWLGGMLTNFQTIRRSIDRMKKLETLLGDEEQRKRYTKKELLMMDREREKLEFSLGGIKDMTASPQLVFVVDTKREDIAVKEAERLDIPVIALVDTNCNPDTVDYVIPSNDDATRAIKLFAAAIADAVQEGRVIRAQRGPSAEEIAREERARNAAARANESRPNNRKRDGRQRPGGRGGRSGQAQAAPAVETPDAVEDVGMSGGEEPFESSGSESN